MKAALFSLFYALFVYTNVTAQIFASTTNFEKYKPVKYTDLYLIDHVVHGPDNMTKFVGGMIAATGGGCFLGGGFVLNYLTYNRDLGTTNYSMQNLGFGLMIGGVALAVTGLALAIKGHHEKKYGWSLSPISTKPNEVGIAYNF